MSTNLNLITDLNAEVSLECCVCYEEIGEKNNCTTACGHKFCLICLMKSMQMNNCCPMCRANIMPEEENDYDDDDDDDDDDDSDSDADSRVSRDWGEMDEMYFKDCTGNGATPEMVAVALERQGYTMSDLLSIMMMRYSRDDAVRPTLSAVMEMNSTFEKNMQNTIDFLDNEVKNQYNERFMFMEEDTRRHNRTVPSLLESAEKREENVVGTMFGGQ